MEPLHLTPTPASAQSPPTQIHTYADRLQILPPDFGHVKDKIRRQLQVLRGNGVLEFVRRGKYRLRS